VKFLRFFDETVKKRLNVVLEKIQWWIEDNTPRRSAPPHPACADSEISRGE